MLSLRIRWIDKNKSLQKKKTPPMLSLCLLVFTSAVVDVYGHGYLQDPPGRASLYRFKDDPLIAPFADEIKENIFDSGIRCFEEDKRNKTCGVCGDHPSAPKDNEAGGKYALGIITRYYEVGQIIPVEIFILNPHGGYFEFRLCPWNDTNTPITHECLKGHRLRLADGNKRWNEAPDALFGTKTIQVQLPEGVACTQCVLQWKYITSPFVRGRRTEDAFYSCSDIAIGVDPPSEETSTVAPTTAARQAIHTTNEPITTRNQTQLTCLPEDFGTRKCHGCNGFYRCREGKTPTLISCRHGRKCQRSSGRCLNSSKVPSCQE